MSSFLGKFKSNSDAKSAATTASPAKKDPNAHQPTPLERMLENAGPIRNDGSDKFFGMENFGNTCYCNSILQCLYYTPPFRESIITYPQRSTPEVIAAAAATAVPRPPYRLQNGVLVKPGQPPPPPPNKQVITPAQQPGQKLEDKDSPEYKKKLALVAGPILNVTYQNAASYNMPETLFTSLKDIFEAVVAQQTRNGIVSPAKLLEVLRRDNEMFRSAMHQDAQEFLNLLLNSVIESIEENEKQSKHQKQTEKIEQSNDDGQSPETPAVSWPSILPQPISNSPTKLLRDLFEGTSTSETRCLTCETTSRRDEPFLDLSVDLEQHSSVTSCLNRFSREEMLCEREKFHCDNCGGLQEAEKRMKLKRLPQILALHLKRFKYFEDQGRMQKLFHKVVYPYYLRLFHTTDDAEDPDRLYELYAVVVHVGGGPYHGHYVSIVKTQDRGWLLFDDEMVEPVDRSYVKNFFGDKAGLACAYMLFYRATTEEEVRKEQRMEGRPRPSQDMVWDTFTAPTSAEMHRVQSASPPVSPTDGALFANLDHALTAPQAIPNGHVESTLAPTQTVVPVSQAVQSKKEKAKEEKERKAAEKEREKAEKQRKKDMEEKTKEAQKKQAEEAKRNGVTEDADKDNHVNGFTSTFFGRSKSLRISSLGRRDKHVIQPLVGEESSSTITASTTTTNNTSVIEEQDEKDTTGGSENSKDKDKEKKSRFSIRKKSFGVFS